MVPPVRWFGAAALGSLAVLGVLVPQAQAQRQFIFAPALGSPGVGVNTNYWLNPYTTLQQQAYNTAVVGSALSTIPPYWLGFNPYPQYVTYGYGGYSPYGYGGYGSLLSTGYGGTGGYGSPPPGGYGGSGTSPYGYLRGAAELTTANAQYQKTLEEARGLRAKTQVAELDARRRRVDEIEYERSKQPTALTMKAQDDAAALNEARNNPPPSAVLDGSTLNALLREAQKQQNAGRRGPNVPLTEDVLKAVNLTPHNTHGNVGLLKDGRKLRWPDALGGEEFATARKTIERLIAHAVQEVTFNHPVERETLNDLRVALKALGEALSDHIGELSPSEYIAGRRYLNQLGQAVTALSDPKVFSYFNTDWAARGKNVAELVQFLSDNGLVFAPAAPGDESAYRALYNALAAFDAGLHLAQK
jgi:hypothetical protein